MHAVGRLFPRANRSPAIQPTAPARTGAPAEGRALAAGLDHRAHPPHQVRLLHLPGPGAGAPVSPARPQASRRERRDRRVPGARMSVFRPGEGLPVSRLLRLSLIQAAAGMTLVLLDGALNRILIVEMHVSAVLVTLMIGAPLVFAPLRAVIGFRSDIHASALGWRRTPLPHPRRHGAVRRLGHHALLPAGHDPGSSRRLGGDRRSGSDAELPARRRGSLRHPDHGPGARRRHRAGRPAHPRRRA